MAAEAPQAVALGAAAMTLVQVRQFLWDEIGLKRQFSQAMALQWTPCSFFRLAGRVFALAGNVRKLL